MTTETILQENSELESLQAIIKNIKNKLAKYAPLLSKRPNTYLSKIAKLQHDLGCMYFYECKDYDLAEQMFLQALDNYKKYTGRKKNITSEKIKNMESLVHLYNRTNRLDLSEKILLRILEQQKELAQRSWLIYLEEVAVTQWKLGNLYVDMQRFIAAEQMYLTSLDTRATFDCEDIYRYYPGTAQCYRSLGRLYDLHFNDQPKAEIYYQKSAGILQELTE